VITTLISQADPHVEIWLALNCPVCDHRWKITLDITSYLWAEIDRWARRLLSQVHIIASNYGWGESDILALSPLRRQNYLDLIQGKAW
jgi:hypothetical protein